MKKFVGFYYRCSFNVFLWVVLSLIGFTVLSSPAFAQCTQMSQCLYGDYYYTVSNGAVTITQYIGAGGNVVIPSTINGMPVVSIDGYRYYDAMFIYYGGAFEGCTNVTSVTIPGSVTSIGNMAFEFCSGLTSMNSSLGSGIANIPDSVTSIGSDAFVGCTSLTSVTIPISVTSIGNMVFSGCSSLTSIVVDTGNTVYSSQDGVLYDKAKTVLRQYPGGKSGGFTIPDSVTSIWYYAFRNCSGLTSVTIPNSVTYIRNQAFAYCTVLTKAYFLGNAPSMGSSVFYGCASDFSVCYNAGATGFTSPTWNGYPASVCVPPTVINLSSFTATPKAGKVILQWSTESETDNAGFNIYRSTSEDGEYIKINESLIPAQGFPTEGAVYEFADNDVQNRKTYYYKLEDIDLNGTSTMHGPVSAMPRLIYGIGK